MGRKVLPVSESIFNVQVLMHFCTNHLKEEDVPAFLAQCNLLSDELMKFGAREESEQIKDALIRLREIESLAERKQAATPVFLENAVITWQDFETI